MALCEHGINHAGERHGCDGCCKKIETQVDVCRTCGRIDCDAICFDPLEEIDRLRGELAAANAEIERLKAQLEQARHHHTNEYIDRTNEQAAHAATTAKLGRAVAALRMIRGHGMPRGATLAEQQECDAILGDAESREAGEAYREMEAVYEAARSFKMDVFLPSFAERYPGLHRTLVLIQRLVSAVDARRGAK